MTRPTNQYEADEKFDIEQDKLEERIQRKINVIYIDENKIEESIINYVVSNDLIHTAIRWQAEQDIKNNED